MKTARFILKIVATVMAAAAVVCTIIAFWDHIMDLFDAIVDKVEEKRADRSFQPAEYDDYDDGIL